MATPHGPDKVLAQVASRLRWARYGHRLSRLVLWTSIVAAVVVLMQADLHSECAIRDGQELPDG